MVDSTERFTTRVENYIKYRPDYPRAIIDLLRAECALTASAIVADIGSGTGKLAGLFLENGNRVFGIEPNDAMREAGEHLLAAYSRFTSIDGTAEATTIPNASVDFVMAGQAFHWFDVENARREWARILKADGWVVLVWNTRRTTGTPFLEAYEQLLQRYGTDYQAVRHEQIADDALRSFFGGAGPKLATFENRQAFDFDGLKGRLLSSSYTPELEHSTHQPMLDASRTIFEEHAREGKVHFDYNTEVYYGHLAG
ncbi:MAG: class I SAM-dependent methyltransferase [Ardenticatenaceae bacterium]